MPELKITAAVAVFLLVIVIGGFVFWQIQSFNNPTSLKFAVTKATASPSNATPPASADPFTGLVTITADVENKGLETETVLVVMQVKEPNGDLMSLPNSTQTVEVVGGGSKSVVFEPMIPLNSKIGEFKVNIDVNDSKQQNIRYYSTGFNCPFTTPIYYSFFFISQVGAPSSRCWMTVDGITYDNCDGRGFYWYLGTNHTITVPYIINASPYFELHLAQGEEIKWSGPDHNTFFLNVTADVPTSYPIFYNPVFKGDWKDS